MIYRSSTSHHNSHSFPCCTSEVYSPVHHTSDSGIPRQRTSALDRPARGTSKGDNPTGCTSYGGTSSCYTYGGGSSTWCTSGGGCPNATQPPSTTPIYTAPHRRTQQQINSPPPFPATMQPRCPTTPHHVSLEPTVTGEQPTPQTYG
jgi:hypothetical protein